MRKEDHTLGQEGNPAFPTQFCCGIFNPLWDFAINMIIQISIAHDTEREKHDFSNKTIQITKKNTQRTHHC